MLLAALTGEDARLLLEVVMKTEGYEYESEFARKNFAEGKAEGRAESMRQMVAALCKAHGIGWDRARAAAIAARTATELEQLALSISAERRWPDEA